MLKIIVLLGGTSPEREVSLTSGQEISKQLKQNGHEVTEIDPAAYQYSHEMIKVIQEHNPDMVFIGLHGGDGENGVLQAMLSGSGIPHTGSHFKSSTIAMDKLLSKFVAEVADVMVPEYMIIDKQEYVSHDYCGFKASRNILSGSSNLPLVIKPVDAGSSVGVHIVSNESEWEPALQDAFNYSDRVILEEFIEGRELTVTVINGEAYPVVEIIPHEGFYDYKNKYTKGNTTYQSPADLTPSETSDVQEQAIRIWQAMQCSGYARIDFRYNGEVFYFLEVNTLPGMTPLSLTPMAAKAKGLGFGDLLEKIIDVSLTSVNKHK